MPEACNFIKKDTLAQVFSCEFCEIFKNTFLTEYIWMTASDDLKNEIIETERIYLLILSLFYFG